MEKYISKKEIIKQYHDDAGCTIKEATVSINLLIKIVTEALKTGKPVRLDGIGTFEVRERNKYKGFNPQTGKRIEIGETSFLHFSPTPALTRDINTWRFWPDEEKGQEQKLLAK